MRRGLATLVLALGSLSVLAVPASADWTTWGNGLARHGQATGSRVHASNAAALRLAWSRPVGGLVSAQPLEISDVSIGGTRRDVYIVATESGTIVAFDAADGVRVWTRDLGVSRVPCTQVPRGVYGITGTPVYDPSARALYVAAAGTLVALDIRTGAPLHGWPVALGFDPQKEHVWGALALRGPLVYLETASYCDIQPYEGRVVRVDVRTRTLVQWLPVPTPGLDGGGGMWGWGGASIDAAGRVWVATGNAIGPDVTTEAAGDAESVVELSAALGRIAGSHAPGVPGSGDYDFGATPLLFQPAGCPALVAALDKNGSLYLWRRAELASGPYQRLALAAPETLFGLPAFDTASNRLFLTTTAGSGRYRSGLQALALGSDCRAHVSWTQPLGSLLSSVPTVLNDVVAVGTGTGRLRLFRSSDGAPLASFAVGTAFDAPIAVGRDVAIATWGRRISVFRLP